MPLFFEISKNVSRGGSVWGPVTKIEYDVLSPNLQHKFYNIFPICSFRPIDKQSAVLC